MHQETHTEHSPAAHHGSYWPIITALGCGLLPTGVLVSVWANRTAGLALLFLGAIVLLGGVGGWLNSLIRERLDLKDLLNRVGWQKNAVKLFLVSEAAIFGALFFHHFYSRVHAAVWPPEGSPELHTRLPFIATVLLASSSFTVHWALKAIEEGKKIASQRWLLFTLILGIVFLSIQGYEWGYLKSFDEFTLKNGTFGTTFYMMTGFHGLHVSMGLVVLAMTFVRLQLGHFTPQNHFFYTGASWYWHFVDVVWVFLFGTMYLL